MKRMVKSDAVKGASIDELASGSVAARRQVLDAMLASALLGGLFAAPPSSLAAPAGPAGALLTILDGEAIVRLGPRSVAAAEGLQLPEGTLLETNSRTGLLRLEWSDGSMLDLGPDTALMLQPGALGRAGDASPAYYLLRGWVKQIAAAAAHRGGVASQVDVLPGQGVVVLHSAAGQTWVFAEAADARLQERGGAAARVALRAGTAYLRQGSARGETAPRPHPDLLRQVPRGFRDSIGPRALRFKGQPVPKPAALPAPDYAALQPWLTAEPAVRRDFPRRFAPLLKEPGFRAAVDAKLNLHPEWEPVLRPPSPMPSAKPYEDKK